MHWLPKGIFFLLFSSQILLSFSQINQRADYGFLTALAQKKKKKVQQSHKSILLIFQIAPFA